VIWKDGDPKREVVESRCGVIVDGWTWTVMDPIHCDQPPEAHARRKEQEPKP
jgi:hypothetical protein